MEKSFSPNHCATQCSAGLGFNVNIDTCFIYVDMPTVICVQSGLAGHRDVVKERDCSHRAANSKFS